MAIIQSKLTAGITKLVEDINYIAFFSNDARSTDTDTIGSKTELFRIAVTPSVSGVKATISYTLTTAMYGPSSTVASSVSTTVMTLTDASDFTEGDRVIVKVSGNFQKRRITDVTGNQITLDTALSAIPANGTVIRVLITQRAIIENGTGSANSGTLYQIEDWEYEKQQGVEVPGTIDLKLESN